MPIFLLLKNIRRMILSSRNQIETSPEKLSPAKIKRGLKTSIIGREIICLDRTDSTNNAAKYLADKGCKEGAVVIAEEQTKGRGRLGREWLSAPYKNILMSIVFRPSLRSSKVFYLTMISSIAIVKAIKKIAGLNAGIKWPNDIYYNGKKLGGILTELNADMNGINYAIVGIGLNVNFDPALYAELNGKAASLYKESGKIISRNKLLRRILSEIEREYNLLIRGDIDKIRREWNDRSLVSGKPVIIYSGSSAEEGIAESIAEDGSLILLKNNGEKKNIFCGDVSLRLK